MRENVLRGLARRAATDLKFLRMAREDLGGTLASNGYHLSNGEMRLIEGLRRRTAWMTEEELARALASGLKGRSGTRPGRPARVGGAQLPERVPRGRQGVA